MTKLSFLLLFVFASAGAFALPKAPINDLNFRPMNLLMLTASDDAYDFEGIVKLSNCSGSMIKFEGQSDNANALVMTNGHCVPMGIFGGFIKPGEAVINKKVSRSMKIFKDKNTLFNITATKIVYATMTKTDVAIYELDESYAAIEKRTGVTPFTLSSHHPVAGTSINIISGYWERGYSCNIDAFIPTLKEADWTWFDSARYTKECNTIGGTSGSPIIASGTREVIAINNTGNESGQTCTMNNPCEVDENGEISIRQGINYGQQTFDIYTCLNENFVIDTTVSGCVLTK